MADTLFDLTDEDLDIGYLNLSKQEHRIESEIVRVLDEMWLLYQPYADRDFKREFARDPNGRFWEMLLTVRLLGAGKRLLTRQEHPGGEIGYGPDICCIDDGRRIWIEAIAPDNGDPSNPDHVPELVPLNHGGKVEKVPRRQLELRIAGALSTKQDQFLSYRDQGLISANDLQIVAISGCRLGPRSRTGQLPLPAHVLFPLGTEYVRFDTGTGSVVDSGYHHSESIERTGKSSIPRTAFQHEHFCNLAGLIWSTDSIGNFDRMCSDLQYFHNPLAIHALVKHWYPWIREFVVQDEGDQYSLVTL